MAKVICSTCRFRFKNIKLPEGIVNCSVSNTQKKESALRSCEDHRVLYI